MENTKNRRELLSLESKNSFNYDSKWINQIFFKSWWTFLFVIICFYAYSKGLEIKNQDKVLLQTKVSELIKEKEKALNIHEELCLQIKSQNDPLWIELILMKELGLVPEGSTKVFFKTKKEKSP